MNDILQNLNENQYQAVVSPLGPVLIIAGAGSGKTLSLTKRFAYLIQNMGFDENEILAITFTNKAANEMKKRVERVLNSEKNFNIYTYHSLCAKILRIDGENINIESNFQILDEEDNEKIVKDLYKENNLLFATFPTKKMVRLIEKIKSKEYNVENIGKYQEVLTSHLMYEDIEKLTKIYKSYISYTKEQNLLNYDDLLNYTEKLLSIPQFQEKWKNKFKYILVDEFQDTNYIQFSILKKLINENENIFVVGDPDQTIYTWRGAYPHIFDDYLKMFKNTKIIILNENYRSTKNILFAANTLIEHNKKRIKKQLVTNNALGESIYFHEARNGDEEGRFVASEITDLVSKHGYKYNQIAILYRSNYLSREIEQQLIAHSLPYVIYGGRKFYERAEIKDLISYLRLLVNAKDEVALKRVINIPNRKIGMATLDKIKDFSKQNNLQFFEALKISLVEPEKAMWPTKNISDFLLLLAKIKAECENLNMVDKLKKIVDEIKYKEYLDAIDKEKFNNVESLYSSLNEYMNKKPNASLSQWLQEISLYTAGEDDYENEKITLMTIHTAKGLEFKVVFVIGLNDGVFPSSNSLFNDNNLEEERRVAYVAITRSKERLYLSCNKGFSFQLNRELTKSRFLNDIGLENLKFINIEGKSSSSLNLNWYDSKKVNYDDLIEKENVYEYKVGDNVSHTVFGEGKVVSMNNGFLDISFKGKGIKTVMKNHKNLKYVF